MSNPAPCIGLLGKIFGHKFHDWTTGLEQWDFCQRCGMPKGGWK